MKPQDIVFIVVLIVLVAWKRDPKYLVYAGLVSLMLALPLFEYWIFFTAQRIVMYAYTFFLIAVFLNIYRVYRSPK